MKGQKSDQLGKVVLLLVSLPNREAVAAACVAKLKIPKAKVDKLIDEARRQVTVAADFHRDEEIGRAVVRLNDLYTRSLQVQDVKTALAAQKELNKLLDLGSRPAQPDPADTHSEADGELARVREYLDPLKLGRKTCSTAELARRAVAKIVNVKD